MTLKTELKSILLPLIIFQMFRLTLLHWNPRVSRLSLANLNDPDGHSDRVPALLCEERRIFQKYDHFCTVPLQQAYMVLWPDGFHSLVKGTWVCQKSLEGLSKHEKQRSNSLVWTSRGNQAPLMTWPMPSIHWGSAGTVRLVRVKEWWMQ